jgi:protease II
MAPLTPDEVKPHLDSADEDLKQHNFTFKSFDGKDVPVMLIANSKATRDAPLLMSVYGGCACPSETMLIH